MTLIAWPLERNTIRREVRNNAFGMVRNGGTRAHQGWDLVGLAGRIDPAQLYGAVPVGWTFFDGHGSKVSTAGAMGLRIPGANVREGIK